MLDITKFLQQNRIEQNFTKLNISAKMYVMFLLDWFEIEMEFILNY